MKGDADQNGLRPGPQPAECGSRGAGGQQLEKLSLILQMLPGFVWSERAGGELDYLNQQGPYLDALGAEGAV